MLPARGLGYLRAGSWRCARAWCRHSSEAATSQQVVLYRARSLADESRKVENAINYATLGMSGGMGMAFRTGAFDFAKSLYGRLTLGNCPSAVRIQLHDAATLCAEKTLGHGVAQ
eukprot:Skav218992  [mRNA]  locus=scaffold169:187795:191040:+ [translate_table: standard]